jgi:hypothetical protein
MEARKPKIKVAAGQMTGEGTHPSLQLTSFYPYMEESWKELSLASFVTAPFSLMRAPPHDLFPKDLLLLMSSHCGLGFNLGI